MSLIYGKSCIVANLRGSFAEYLVCQVGNGLRDNRWDLEARAFMGWCYRMDHRKKDTPCPNCGHHAHGGEACGSPLGEVPHHDLCLCGAEGRDIPKRATTIDLEVLRFAFEWIDEASSIFRRLDVQDKDIQRRIQKLIARRGSGAASLFAPKKAQEDFKQLPKTGI